MTDIDTETIKFWTPYIGFLVAGISAFIWLQADVRAAEEKISELSSNSKQLELIQTEIRISDAQKELLLKQLQAEQSEIKGLLQAISNRLP